MLEFNVQKVSQ